MAYKRIVNWMFIFAMVAVNGCSKDSTENSQAPVLVTSNLVNAVELVVTGSSAAEVSSKSARAFGEEIGLLQKITNSGKIESVFNASLYVHNVVVSDHYVYTSGEFYGILGEGGDTIDCYLLASKRDSKDEPSKCLSTFRVGIYQPEMAVENGFYDGVGMLVRNSSIYFLGTDYESSRLLRWTEGAPQAEVLLEFSGNNIQMTDVFASTVNDNLCVVTPPVNSFAGRVTCGDPESEPNWQNATALFGVKSGDFQVGDYIFGIDTTKISDLSVTAPLGIGLPSSLADICYMKDGSAILISNQKLYHVSVAAELSVVDNALSWERILPRGDYCWGIASGGLRRVDRDTVVLDATDFLAGANMLQIKSMSFSSEHLIRVDGTNSTGAAVSVYANTQDGSITVGGENRPRFIDVISLQ